MQQSRRPLVLILLIGFLALCGCAVLYIFSLSSQTLSGAPPPAAEPGESEPTEPVSSTAVAPQETAQPALPERRRLTLEFPPRIRAGDADVVRLTLEVDDLGNLTPTAVVGGNVIEGEVIEIPNLYETHHVIAEARFDLAGMEVRPADLVSEALLPATAVTFRWSIRPQDVGLYRGTVWLYLRFVDKLTAEESRKTISAQPVEIEAVNILGLSGSFARTVGVVGSVVGTILGFPFFEDVLKFIFRRRSRVAR